jgi:hypothetical protein
MVDTIAPMNSFRLRLLCHLAWTLTVAWALTGCGTLGRQSRELVHATRPNATGHFVWTPADQAHWTAVRFPGKRHTTFKLVDHEKRSGTQADAIQSISMLRHTLRVPTEQLGTLKFAWQVPALIEGADMGLRHADDSPVRVVLAFEGDRGKFAARDAMLSELSHLLTGEELPYATLMYVWSNHHAVGSVIANPRTERIQKIVVESGTPNLKRWLEYERDVRADFQQAFGEAPGALVAIGLMTDSDNTQSTTRAWYGDIRLTAPHDVPSPLHPQ